MLAAMDAEASQSGDICATMLAEVYEAPVRNLEQWMNEVAIPSPPVPSMLCSPTASSGADDGLRRAADIMRSGNNCVCDDSSSLSDSMSADEDLTESGKTPTMADVPRLRQRRRRWLRKIHRLRKENEEFKAQAFDMRQKKNEFAAAMDSHFRDVELKEMESRTQISHLEAEQVHAESGKEDLEREGATLQCQFDEMSIQQKSSEDRVQFLMDHLVNLLSRGPSTDGNEELPHEILADGEERYLASSVRLDLFRQQLEHARQDNRNRAQLLSTRQCATTAIHERICELQNEIFNGKRGGTPAQAPSNGNSPLRRAPARLGEDGRGNLPDEHACAPLLRREEDVRAVMKQLQMQLSATAPRTSEGPPTDLVDVAEVDFAPGHFTSDNSATKVVGAVCRQRFGPRPGDSLLVAAADSVSTAEYDELHVAEDTSDHGSDDPAVAAGARCAEVPAELQLPSPRALPRSPSSPSEPRLANASSPPPPTDMTEGLGQGSGGSLPELSANTTRDASLDARLHDALVGVAFELPVVRIGGQPGSYRFGEDTRATVAILDGQLAAARDGQSFVPIRSFLLSFSNACQTSSRTALAPLPAQALPGSSSSPGPSRSSGDTIARLGTPPPGCGGSGGSTLVPAHSVAACRRSPGAGSTPQATGGASLTAPAGRRLSCPRAQAWGSAASRGGTFSPTAAGKQQPLSARQTPPALRENRGSLGGFLGHSRSIPNGLAASTASRSSEPTRQHHAQTPPPIRRLHIAGAAVASASSIGVGGAEQLDERASSSTARATSAPPNSTTAQLGVPRALGVSVKPAEHAPARLSPSLARGEASGTVTRVRGEAAVSGAGSLSLEVAARSGSPQPSGGFLNHSRSFPTTGMAVAVSRSDTERVLSPAQLRVPQHMLSHGSSMELGPSLLAPQPQNLQKAQQPGGPGVGAPVRVGNLTARAGSAAGATSAGVERSSSSTARALSAPPNSVQVALGASNALGSTLKAVQHVAPSARISPPPRVVSPSPSTPGTGMRAVSVPLISGDPGAGAGGGGGGGDALIVRGRYIVPAHQGGMTQGRHGGSPHGQMVPALATPRTAGLPSSFATTASPLRNTAPSAAGQR